MTRQKDLYYIKYMAQMWYLKTDLGGIKKGVINQAQALQIPERDRGKNLIPLSWALAEGLVEADTSEADTIDKLTFYEPGKMPKKEALENQGDTPSAELPKAKKFLVNELGEIIRAREATE